MNTVRDLQTGCTSAITAASIAQRTVHQVRCCQLRELFLRRYQPSPGGVESSSKCAADAEQRIEFASCRPWVTDPIAAVTVNEPVPAAA